MKTYSNYNFFKHTYCEFTEIDADFFKENPVHFKSKADSFYSYTEKGVYRYSNHWGRVANCRWKLKANRLYKNQEMHLGFANWTEFYSMNETEKLFYIKVDYDLKKVSFHHKMEKIYVFVFTSSEAQKRVSIIQKLLKETKWAAYFEQSIDKLRVLLITELTNSNQSIQLLKMQLKQGA